MAATQPANSANPAPATAKLSEMTSRERFPRQTIVWKLDHRRAFRA
jgi:hypothetical protein